MIKRTIRSNMPETNSSSSHVIAIFPSDITDLSGIRPYISEDGKTLTIPGGGDFGRGQEDFNDIISKMQYACYRFNSFYAHHQPVFEKVVKGFLGVENIIYDWIDDEKFEEWCEQNPDVEVSKCPLLYSPIDGHKLDEGPQVDHESVDLIEKIVYENEDTLREFLFSENSWLFSGEETTDPSEIFPGLDSHSGCLTLRLSPDNINLYGEDSIDFEVYRDFPESKEGLHYGIHKTYWGDGINSKSWVCVDGDSLDYTDLLLRLNSVWAKKDDGRFYLMFGDIPTKDISTYVPWFLPSSFTFPFTVNFYPVSMFTSRDIQGELHEVLNNYYKEDDKIHINDWIKGYDSQIAFSINMIPSFSNIKINEYI